MCFGCSNLPFFQLLQREMEGGCKESWWGQTQGDESLQGEGGAGRCQADVRPCFHWAHPNQSLEEEEGGK